MYVYEHPFVEALPFTCKEYMRHSRISFKLIEQLYSFVLISDHLPSLSTSTNAPPRQFPDRRRSHKRRKAKKAKENWSKFAILATGLVFLIEKLYRNEIEKRIYFLHSSKCCRVGSKQKITAIVAILQTFFGSDLHGKRAIEVSFHFFFPSQLKSLVMPEKNKRKAIFGLFFSQKGLFFDMLQDL